MKKSIILLVAFLLLSLMATPPVSPIFFASAQGVEIPTPREETWYKVTTTNGLFGWEKWNPLTTPYADFEGLNAFVGEFFWYDNAVTGKRIWWLATGVDYSSDFMKVTFHLRQGVHWNDGEPFTSRDVKFTIELIKSLPEAANYAYMNEWIDSVETPDDYTVVFNLKKPNIGRFDRDPWGAAIWGFLLILPEHIWKEIEDPLAWNNSEDPVFTGPYKLYKTIPESKMFVYIRDENYWGKALGYMPEPKYIVTRNPAPTDVDYMSWVQGLVDYVGAYILPKDLIESAISGGLPNVTALAMNNPMISDIKVNCEKYPLSIPELRWAISYCVNKEKISKLYPGGPASPCIAPFANGWASSQMWVDAFKDDVFLKYGDMRAFDLDKATEILDNLDFKDRNGDGVRETPNGTKLSFEILFSADPIFAYYQPMASDIVDNLARVGIEATPRILEQAQVMQKRQFGDFDLCMWCSGAGNWPGNDPLYFLEVWHGKYYAPIGEPGKNYDAGETRFHDPELDSIIDQMQALPPTDPSYRDLAKRGLEIITKNIPDIPMFTVADYFLFSSRYWAGNPTIDDFYCDPSDWDPAQKWVVHRIKATGASPPIESSYVWFAEDVAAFTGADMRTYGPFSEGAYDKIPREDADRLVAEDVASFQAPIPGLSQILSSISEVSSAMNTLQSSMASSLTEVSSNVTALSSQMSTLTAGLVVEGIAIVILAVALLMRRK